MSAESCLRIRKDIVVFDKSIHDIINEFGPHFINDHMNSDWSTVTNKAGVTFLMREDGLGNFPTVRSGASDPEKDE